MGGKDREMSEGEVEGKIGEVQEQEEEVGGVERRSQDG